MDQPKVAICPREAAGKNPSAFDLGSPPCSNLDLQTYLKFLAPLSIGRFLQFVPFLWKVVGFLWKVQEGLIPHSLRPFSSDLFHNFHMGLPHVKRRLTVVGTRRFD